MNTKEEPLVPWAIQWTGTNTKEVIAFATKNPGTDIELRMVRPNVFHRDQLTVETFCGYESLFPGDTLYKRDGDFYIDRSQENQNRKPMTNEAKTQLKEAVQGAMIEGAGKGIKLIKEERLRQILEEGFFPAADSGYTSGELADAGLAYCYAYTLQVRGESHQLLKGLPETSHLPQEWPWLEKWWKPSIDPVRNLVKAGALIAAEIDRLTAEKEEES